MKKGKTEIDVYEKIYQKCRRHLPRELTGSGVFAWFLGPPFPDGKSVPGRFGFPQPLLPEFSLRRSACG